MTQQVEKMSRTINKKKQRNITDEEKVLKKLINRGKKSFAHTYI